MLKKYGKKLGKIGLTLNTPCPNDPPCIFCNKESFIPQTIQGAETVREQLEQGLPYVKRKYPTDEFIAYFQDNTSTYGDLEYLERSFTQALSYPDIRILALSTRPDSIYGELLDMLERTAAGREVWLELGLQSIHDSTLQAIGRGHDYARFKSAYELIREKTDFSAGVHLIIGLPGESDEMIFETFREVNRLKPDYVKIHHLQVIKGTEMERIYNAGDYGPLSLERYTELFCRAVSLIDKSIVIQRNLSRARAGQLVAPKWNIKAEDFKIKVCDYMDTKGIYQGSEVL